MTTRVDKIITGRFAGITGEMFSKNNKIQQLVLSPDWWCFNELGTLIVISLLYLFNI
tara:strand:- start:323 stop:493 length:171 start_codon:yes stop_codon:yes gene_type:complete